MKPLICQAAWLVAGMLRMYRSARRVQRHRQRAAEKVKEKVGSKGRGNAQQAVAQGTGRS